MVAQESGCFHVVKLGVAIQKDANVGGGPLQAADIVLTPSVQGSDDTGGMGAAMGGLESWVSGPGKGTPGGHFHGQRDGACRRRPAFIWRSCAARPRWR